MSAANCAGIHFFILIRQIIDVILVDGIDEAVAEFYLWDNFEEWQIQIAAHTYLYHRIRILESDIVLILTCEVDHLVYSCNKIRTIVVPSLGRELQV